MESQSYASPLQSWAELFPNLSLKTRQGQAKLFRLAVEDAQRDRESQPQDAYRDNTQRLAELPTGYGKTISGLGYYVIRRELGIVNRCLWLVSSREQLNQLAPTEPGAVSASEIIQRRFGVTVLDTVRTRVEPKVFRMHLENRGEIFVATYHLVQKNANFFEELLDPAGTRWQWQWIGDEAHHLGEDGEWAKTLETLPRHSSLYLSATPMRTDKRPLRNVPQAPDGKTYLAEPRVTIREAINEGAIRQPLAHAQEWEMKFKNRRGELVVVSTDDINKKRLQREQDFDAYMKKHDLRFDADYIDRIYVDAATCLSDLNLSGETRFRHQMIVFCMYCSHAKFLANEVFSAYGGLRADWIGTTRQPSEENDRVLAAFKAGEIDVLAQVGKVGEGFDHYPASVGLWLNLASSPEVLVQQLGRIGRRHGERDRISHVFASTDHPVIELVESLEPPEGKFSEKEKDKSERTLPLLPDVSFLETRWLRTDLVSPNGMDRTTYTADVLRTAAKFNRPPEEIMAILHEATGTKHEAPARESETMQQRRYRVLVGDAQTKLTGVAISLLQENGESVKKGLAGRMKRNLNARWKRDGGRAANDSLSEDFKAKYNWLREIHNEMVRMRKVPGWLLAAW